jgi:hypothetical protein
MGSWTFTALVAVSAALLVVSCGGETGGDESVGGIAAKAARELTVDETEFRLDLSETSLEPGTYTFVVRNAGAVEHALELEGRGVAEAATGTLAPGESAELTVTLEEGSYVLFCPIGDHAAQGMKLELSVGGAPPAAPEPEPPAGGGYGSYGGGD